MEINIEKLAGKKVSEWTLIEKIGKGADGIVYRASNDEGKRQTYYYYERNG